MSQTLRIALAQFDFPVGAIASNAERIVAMIAEARDEYGAGLVLFPELALCGYLPEDLPGFDEQAFLREVQDRALALSRRAGTRRIVEDRQA